MIEYIDLILGQKLTNNEWIVRWRVIVQQWSTFWISIFETDTTDSGDQMLQNFEIIVASNCLTKWSEFFMDDSFAIEEWAL